MRTLLISEFFPPRVGGTPTWFSEVYRRYPAGEAVVLTDYQPGDEAVDLRLELPIQRVPMRMEDWGILRPVSLRQYLRLALVAWRLARARQVHMIHCARVMTEGVIGYVLWKLARLPYCVYAHGEEIGTALSSRQLAFLMHRAYGGAQKIIANSEHTRSLLRGVGVPDAKIVVIHPAVDSAHFRPCDNGMLARKRVGLNGHRVILSVGRLQRRKGHDMVIKALPAIAAAVPNVRYVIAGTGEEEPRLRTLAEEMRVAHVVQFAGRVPDAQLPAYYQACDLFLMPNREEGHQDIEGFGIVFLEASACGKPVIGGRSGGTGEAIVDGETGLRTDGESVETIADAAIALLQDRERAEEMGRRGRARVVERFDWDRVAARTMQLK